MVSSLRGYRYARDMKTPPAHFGAEGVTGARKLAENRLASIAAAPIIYVLLSGARRRYEQVRPLII
jgi:hypothetical protein